MQWRLFQSIVVLDFLAHEWNGVPCVNVTELNLYSTSNWGRVNGINFDENMRQGALPALLLSGANPIKLFTP